jgi:hypothetical protein
MLTSWLFIGFDYSVGDHEVGSGWDPFIKSKSTFRMLFENPSRNGLDYERFDTLSPVRKKEFIEYCTYRRGVSDSLECQKINDSNII